MKAESERQKEKYKIVLIIILLASVCFFTYYYYKITKTHVLVTHLYYLPIILASLWWRIKGLSVAVFLAAFLLFHYLFVKDSMAHLPNFEDYFRVLIFVIIGAVVSWLSERIAKKNKELRNTRDYLDNLFNYANAPIIVWDTERRITRFNYAFEYLTGHTAGDVVGQELSMLFPESSKEESLRKIANTLIGDYWESVEIPILRKDGNVRCVLWNSANIYAEDGVTVIATIAQGQDISERKLAEEHRDKLIADLQKALSEIKTLRGFLPICSHCKNIRDDKGYWDKIESYLHKHSDAKFSHSICPECAKKYYPDMDLYEDAK